jgi:hypothetical protein
MLLDAYGGLLLVPRWNIKFIELNHRLLLLLLLLLLCEYNRIIYMVQSKNTTTDGNTCIIRYITYLIFLRLRGAFIIFSVYWIISIKLYTYYTVHEKTQSRYNIMLQVVKSCIYTCNYCTGWWLHFSAGVNEKGSSDIYGENINTYSYR